MTTHKTHAIIGMVLLVCTLLLFSVPNVFALNSSDVVVYYSFDDDDLSGSNPLDITPNGNDGTNIGATTGVTGILNEAFDFDSASTDYINTNTAFAYTSGDAFTISTWIYPTSYGGGGFGRIFSTERNSPNAGILFYINSGNTIDVGFTGRTGVVQSSSGHFSLNTWVHAVAVYDGGTGIKIYIDGVERANNPTYGSPLSSTVNGLIGKAANGNTRNFDGKIDEVAIWDRALTAQEISVLYNSGNGLQYPYNVPLPINITFQSQTPSDLNDVNVADGVTINYTITNRNTTNTTLNPYLNFTITNGNQCLRIDNQVCVQEFNEYRQVASDTNSSNIFSWFLPCTSLIPQTANIDFEYMINEPKTFLSIPTNQDEPKVTLYNVSTDAEEYLLHAYLNATTGVDVNVYACDDSYTTGNFFSQCTLIGTMENVNETDVTNFGDGNLGTESFYDTLRFTASNGVVNGLQFTDTMQFIFEADAPFTIGYISNDTGTFETANGNGASWDSITGTADVFLRMFEGTENLTYQACGQGTDGNVSCSPFIEDAYDLQPIIPVAPSLTLITPTQAQSFAQTQTINVTWNAFDGNNDTLTFDVVVDDVTLASGISTTFYELSLVSFLGATNIEVIASDSVFTTSRDVDIIVTEEAVNETGGTTIAFDWNVDNPSPELFSCPTNPIQFSILAGAFILVFLFYGIGLSMKNAMKPIILATCGIVTLVLVLFFTGCSMVLATLIGILGLAMLFSSLVIPF